MRRFLSVLIAYLILSLTAGGTWAFTGSPISGGGSGTTETRASLGIAETDNVAFNKVTATEGFVVPQSATVPGDVKLYELSGNGTNYVGIKAPDNVTTTYQYILPPDKCTNGQSLRFTSDNVTLECYTPASGGLKSFNMLYNAPDSADNTSPWRSSVAVTIAEIGGYFIDNTGAISTSSSDNAVVQLSFCPQDNVTNCTSIDNTTIVGGTSIYSDQSMGGTAVVPAKAAIILKFGTINTTKPFMVNVFYTEN